MRFLSHLIVGVYCRARLSLIMIKISLKLATGGISSYFLLIGRAQSQILHRYMYLFFTIKLLGSTLIFVALHSYNPFCQRGSGLCWSFGFGIASFEPGACVSLKIHFISQLSPFHAMRHSH